MSTFLGLLAVIALIGANAWFVAGEFALVAARRSRLEAAAAEGDARSQRALKLLGRLSFVLSGDQLGITVTSLAVGFIAAPVFTTLLSPVLAPLGLSDSISAGLAVGIGLTLSTAAQMVFGELGPKNLAIAKPEEVAGSISRLKLIYLALFGPLIRLFDTAANRLIATFGIEPTEELETAVTVEELEHIIATSSASGALGPAVARLLQRSIEFGAIRAGVAMTTRAGVVSIAAEESCADLARLVAESGHSRFPVVGPRGLDDIIGVVSVKELLEVPFTEREITAVRALAEPELVVPETLGVREVLRLLRDAHTQLAVVVDEFGGTAGVITLEDILEELVGDIRDEHDGEVELAPVRRGDDSWRVPGTWRIDQMRRLTGVQVTDGPYETVSGLVMHALGRLPEVGDTVELEGGRVVVLAVKDRAVRSASVTSTAGPADEEAEA